jgi:hypothetical protein
MRRLPLRWAVRRGALPLLATLAALAFAPQAPARDVANPAPARVQRIVGTSLEVVDRDGSTRTGAALAGMEFTLGDADDAPRLRIAAVTADARPGVLLHEVEVRDVNGRWANVCGADRDGRRLALFVEGFDLPDGRQVHAPGRLSITCTAGVRGKCLRAGYHPSDDTHGPGSGLALFQTCTRMYRADYCGDGIGWTRDGMAIDTFDVHLIQRPEEPATLPFEAAWGPQGAVCVHHTRVIERGRLAALLAQCPRLAAGVAGNSCTEAVAHTLPGVLMFNRSADDAASDGSKP